MYMYRYDRVFVVERRNTPPTVFTPFVLVSDPNPETYKRYCVAIVLVLRTEPL